MALFIARKFSYLFRNQYFYVPMNNLKTTRLTEIVNALLLYMNFFLVLFFTKFVTNLGRKDIHKMSYLSYKKR